jgi:L-fuculose-phosphate aldolase
MAAETILREQICEVGRRLYQRNLVAATDGNISIRLAGDRFLCTPSGVSKGYMTPDMLPICSAEGRLVSGACTVTSEIFTHLAAYRERPDINACVHAHPPKATALMLAGLDMTAYILPEVVYAMGAIPTAPYATPGTPEGAEAVAPLVRHCDALLMDRHGALTLGTDVFEALYRMEKLEHAAECLVTAHLLGKVRGLSPDEMRKLHAARSAYGATSRAFFPVGE